MKSLAVLTALLVGPGLAHAADAASATRGEVLYNRHCVTCHGVELAGDGPMSGVLLIKPSDLAGYREAGGEIPVERILRRIDGSDPLTSHGSPMPVYGDFFEGLDRQISLPGGQEMATSLPMLDLLAYIEAQQR